MDPPELLAAGSIDPAAVAAVDLSSVSAMTEWHANGRYFLGAPGREHYRLLSYLAARMPPGSRVVDVGTYLGFSALALSTGAALVDSYDIMDCISPPSVADPTVKQRANVTLHVPRSCFDDMPRIMQSPFIVLDVDPHDGVQERRFFDMLEAAGYRGHVLCDDIHLNEDMRAFWEGVTQPKVDLTHVGHWSGTGLVAFR
jgi:hypothetical protein